MKKGKEMCKTRWVDNAFKIFMIYSYIVNALQTVQLRNRMEKPGQIYTVISIINVTIFLYNNIDNHSEYFIMQRLEVLG